MDEYSNAAAVARQSSLTTLTMAQRSTDFLGYRFNLPPPGFSSIPPPASPSATGKFRLFQIYVSTYFEDKDPHLHKWEYAFILMCLQLHDRNLSSHLFISCFIFKLFIEQVTWFEVFIKMVFLSLIAALFVCCAYTYKVYLVYHYSTLSVRWASF